MARPVTFGEIYATLYKNLGIDVATAAIQDIENRPQTLVEPNSRPIRELF